MRVELLEEAIEETQRFLDRANRLLSNPEQVDDGGYVVNSALSASVRRASMDATRALAALRRPDS